LAFSSTPADSNNIPIGCVYVPGVGFKALQGGTLFTDGSSNDSAPARLELTGGSKATYTYSAGAIATFATMQDLVVLRGSATKLVKVTRVELSGSATAATQILFWLKKHTIADTGGTSTNQTVTKHDSNDGAATALAMLYTIQATVDASATIVRQGRLTLAVAPAATANLNDRYVVDFGMRGAEPIVLRGVAQEFALNFNGQATTAGQLMDYTIEWSEE
jgi:hypothetical protein